MTHDSLPDDLDLWPSNPCELLGVSENDDIASIERAFEALSKKYTRYDCPREHEKLSEAFETLRQKSDRLDSPWGDDSGSSRAKLEGLGESFLDVNDDPWKMESLSLDTETDQPTIETNFETPPPPSALELASESNLPPAEDQQPISHDPEPVDALPFEPEPEVVEPLDAEPVAAEPVVAELAAASERSPLDFDGIHISTKSKTPSFEPLQGDSWQEVPRDPATAAGVRQALESLAKNKTSNPEVYLRLYWMETLYPSDQKPEHWLTVGVGQTGDQRLLDLFLGSDDYETVLSQQAASLCTLPTMLSPEQVFSLAIRRAHLAAARQFPASFYREEKNRVDDCLSNSHNLLWGKYLCRLREAIGFNRESRAREIVSAIRANLQNCPSLSDNCGEAMQWYHLFEQASDHDFDQFTSSGIPYASHFATLAPLLSVEPIDAEAVWLAFVGPLANDPDGAIDAFIEFSKKCPAHFRLFERRIHQLASARGADKIAQPCPEKVGRIFRRISSHGRTTSGVSDDTVHNTFRREALLYCLANQVEIGSFLEQLNDDSVLYGRGQNLVDELPVLQTFSLAYYAFHYCREI